MPSWELVLNDVADLKEADAEHIASLIVQGYTSGMLNDNEEDEE